jgi:pimeloyl-ACP methyl ester carboxylesterase
MDRFLAELAHFHETAPVTIHHVTSRDGTVIEYRKSGSGPPLLFVHGTTAEHRSWMAIAPLFQPNLTVYAMDRRGRGGSGAAPDYDIMREAEDVAAVVDAIGEPVILFGHSFGGLCSLEAALLTDNVSRLILYEPPIPAGERLTPAGVTERIQALVDRGEFEAAMELFLREAAKIPDHELEAYRQSPLWKARIPLTPTIPRELTIEQTYRVDAERFAALQVPTMLLLGGDSPRIYRHSIEVLDSALPESKIVLLPGQQHVAHHSNPELLAREVLRFVDEYGSKW